MPQVGLPALASPMFVSRSVDISSMGGPNGRLGGAAPARAWRFAQQVQLKQAKKRQWQQSAFA